MPNVHPVNERDFTTQIRDLARLLGWARYHTWLSQHSPAGFPDEILVRPPRIVFAELKTDTGKPTPMQTEWLDQLAACHLEVFLWRPHMIDEIAAYLTPHKRPRPPFAPWPGPGVWA